MNKRIMTMFLAVSLILSIGINKITVHATESNIDSQQEEQYSVWDGSTKKEVLPNDNVYLIDEAAELAWFSDAVNSRKNFSGTMVQITGNIDLNKKNWTPIGKVSWHDAAAFDFNGSIQIINCNIKGLKSVAVCSGLFGKIRLQDLTIDNLNISDSTSSKGDWDASVGLLAGSLEICADGNLTIKNSAFLGEISNKQTFSGPTGGVIGYLKLGNGAKAKIEGIKTKVDCKSSATAASLISEVYDNNLSAEMEIRNVNAYGSLNASTSYGYNETSVGGLIGIMRVGNAQIEKVTAEGSILSSGYRGYAGGLIGKATYNVLQIENCAVKTSLESHWNGVYGYVECAGGFLGYSECKNPEESHIKNVYLAGSINDGVAFCAHNSSQSSYISIESCYFDKEIVGLPDNYLMCSGYADIFPIKDEESKALTTAEMSDKNNYKGWDFDNVWIMLNGYPALKEAEEEEQEEGIALKTIKYNDSLDGSEKSADIYWGAELFAADSQRIDTSNPDYYANLVKLSAILSQCSYDVSEDGYLYKALNELGIASSQVMLDTGDTLFNPAHSISYRNFKVNGEEQSVVIVTVRGSTMNTVDWITDFVAATNPYITGYPKEHIGFSMARDKIKKDLKAYILQKGIDTTKAKILITGHSYGAAVANLLSKSVEDIFEKSNIFGYTFAAPNNIVVRGIDGAFGQGMFNLVSPADNIHNFRNGWDPVIHVPKALIPTEVYTIYGKQHFFTLKDAGDQPEDLFWNNHNCTHYVNYALKMAERSPITKLGIRYISIRCPIDVIAYDKEGNIVGKITNNKVDESVTKIMMFVQEDAKNIYIPADGGIRVELIATDAGTMDFDVYDYDAVSGDISDAKKVSNVKLVKEKRFIANITEDVTAANVQLKVVDNEGEVVAIVNEDGSETPKAAEMFTVVFNSDGGSMIDSQTSIKGERVTRPANPTKDGFLFAGWYKEEKCITEWDFENDTLEGDTILYAKWIENSEPTTPIDPTEPTTPVNPTEPTIPVDPTEPTTSVNPSEPTAMEDFSDFVELSTFAEQGENNDNSENKKKHDVLISPKTGDENDWRMFVGLIIFIAVLAMAYSAVSIRHQISNNKG